MQVLSEMSCSVATLCAVTCPFRSSKLVVDFCLLLLSAQQVVLASHVVMVAQNPIVISDSDSDTLSESERPTDQPALKAKLAPVNEQRPSNRSRAVGSTSLQEPGALEQKTPESGSSVAGLLGLLPNRRQLELERKERARKRRREQNLPSSSSDDDEVQSEPKRKRVATAHSDSKQALAAPETPASTSKHAAASYAQPVSRSDKEGSPSGKTTPPFSRATDPIEAESRFWTGTIKHGYNRYADNAKLGVTIPQMLLPATASSRNGLQLAVLATYDLRMDWLWSQFPRGLPVTLILPPPKEDYRTDSAVARPGLHPSEIFGDFSRCPGWQICVPTKPKGGWLTQHMKFFILVHDNFLRVAILSGNLNGIDWERIENTAYIHDFPLLSEAPKPSGTSSIPAGVNDFKSQLVRVLRSLSMPTSHPVYEALNRYDFSQATRARIVASWPEASSLADWDRIETQGLGRLGKVVRDFGVRPARQAPIELECQGSSLANHDVKWIEHFHLLASGVNPRGILPLKGKANETHPEYLRAVGSKVGSLPPVKVCFPSHRYVEERTVEGPLGALSFFGKAETFASSP